MTEYIIEIESFTSEEEASNWAKKYITMKKDKIFNIVSRDVTVIEVSEVLKCQKK